MLFIVFVLDNFVDSAWPVPLIRVKFCMITSRLVAFVPTHVVLVIATSAVVSPHKGLEHELRVRIDPYTSSVSWFRFYCE